MIAGIGIDLIEIERVKKAAERDAFIRRVFTEQEQAYYAARGRRAETLAGMFAAKEAVAKALGCGISEGVRWQDIEVRHHENRMPYVVLSNAAQQKLQALGGRCVHLSISHSKAHAIAQAILEG